MNEYTPNIHFYTKVNCYRKDMTVFPPNSALLGKMNMGKPYNGKYPMFAPLQMDHCFGRHRSLLRNLGIKRA